MQARIPAFFSAGVTVLHFLAESFNPLRRDAQRVAITSMEGSQREYLLATEVTANMAPILSAINWQTIA